ncbi:hypothetical protein D3C78_539880 [compost metagenome]
MADQIAKARVHLRRAAGQVEGVHRMGIDHLIEDSQGGVAHALGARRPGIDVAVQAALVAAIGQVDLQGFQLAAANRREVQGIEQREGVVHGSWCS